MPAAVDNSAPPALELRGVHKWFGPVHANDGVSLAVPAGTIHGIVGENGAGKSTAMSVVYGYYRADAGEVAVHGRRARIAGPEDALRLGIGMVHQHFKLVEPFSVLENVVLGAEGGRLLGPGLAAARAALERLARGFGLEVDPDALVETLPVGLRQRVEILKALHRGAEILILDEPTGVLTPQEADHLFRILRALRDRGKTVVLITHKLREVAALADNVTVMRRGRVAANLRTAETTPAGLAELMIGRPVLPRVEKAPARPGATVLAVEDLEVRGGGARRVRGVSFAVRAGEIVGIAGVAGNGQSELLEALAGIVGVDSGRILFKGADITRQPFAAKARRRMGMAHAPEDRQRTGLVGSFTAAENAILGRHDRPAWTGPLLTKRGAIHDDARRMMAEYDVRPRDPLLQAQSFSGGNQQKIVLAREIDADPDLLLVGQPTRGVDVGAVEFIHRRLLELRGAGKAILLVSVELEEIMALADRILVMFEGRIAGAVDGNAATERELGLMMAGGRAAAGAAR